ncbi:MAG: MmgE/PrpD family protein, partial [Bacillota bacterium]
MTATRLANLISTIRWDTMPRSAVERAKLAVLDYLGVLFAGMSMPLSREMLDNLGGPDALARGEDFALWSGTVARIVDLDDGHRFAMGHPGVPVISGVLASAVESTVTGPQFLEAVIRGYEVYGFLGRVVNPPAYRERGFDSTGICGAVAAAAGVASTRKPDAGEMGHAMAIAGSLCGGLTQYFEDGSSPKYLCSGWAAHLGIKAASFARHGFTGPDSIFGGKSGFCQAFSPKYDSEY